MADIDSLSFSIVLKDEEFRKKLTDLETRAKSFNAVIVRAMQVQAATEADASKYSHISLLNKEKEGAITERELRVLNKVRAIQKALIGVDKERLSVQSRALVSAMQEGEFTENQLKSLSSLLALEKARLNYADKQAAAQERAERGAQRTAEAQARTASDAQDAAAAEDKKRKAADSTTSAYVKQSEVMSQLKALVGTYISVLGGVRLIGSLVRITGEFEAQHAALGAILGDIKEADILFDKLKVLAVKSPYTFAELTSYAKQLSAFSEPTEQLYDTTKKLADVSAGLGVDMSRIVLAWGQVRSAAYLRGQELRQFTEAGIPLLQLLAEQFEELEGRAVSTGEVFEKISSRQVPFEMVAEAFERMTSAGGKFYNMQEVLADTVKGKVANLTDSWQIMLSTIGDNHRGLIGGTLDALKYLVDNMQGLTDGVKGAAVAWAVYKVASIAANNSMSLSVATLRKVVKVLQFFKTTSPWLLAFSALAGITTALASHFKRLNEETNRYKEIVNDTAASASAELSVMEAYLKVLEKTAVGTSDYERTRKELVKYAGNYLSALDKEKLAVGNLAGVYDNLKIAVEGAARAKGMEQAYSEIDQNAQESIQKIYGQVGKVSEAFRIKFEKFVKGSLSMDDLLAGLSGDEIASAIKNLGGKFVLGSVNMGDVERTLDEYAKEINKVKAGVITKRREVQHAFDELYGTGEDDNFSKVIAKVTEMKWDPEFLPKSTELFGEWKKRMQEYSKEAKAVATEYSNMPMASEKMADAVAKRREKGDIADQLLKMFGIGEDAGLNTEQKMINDYIRDKANSYGKILVQSLKATESTTMKDWKAQAKEMYDESRDILTNMTTAMAQQEGETIEEWRERMNGNTYAVAEGRIRFLDDLSEALFGDKGFKNIVAKSETELKSTNAAIRDEVSEVKQMVENTKLLKKYYDELAELGFSDKEIRLLFSTMEMEIPAEGLDKTLEALATRLKALGDKNGAQDVLNYLTGKDMDKSIEALKRSRDEMEKWGEQVEKLQAETKRLGLDGFSLELDKILVDADSKNRQLALEWSQKEQDLAAAKDGWIAAYRIRTENATIEQAERAWKEYYDKQVAMAQKSIDEQIDYNNKVAQKQINDKASGWVSSMLEQSGIDLSDMSDKSLAQLERYLSEMESMASSKSLEELIPDQLKADAEAVKVTFETLLELIHKILGSKQLDVKADLFKKKFDAIAQAFKGVGIDVDFSALTEQLNRFNAALLTEDEGAIKAAQGGLFAAGTGVVVSGVASAISKAAGSMKDWADATNDVQLRDQAENLEFVSSAVQGVGEGLLTAVRLGGTFGTILGIGTSLLSVVSAIFNKVVAARKVNYELEMSTRQLVADYKQLNYELKEFNEVFGDFSLDKATDALNKYNLAVKDLNEMLSLKNVKESLSGLSHSLFNFSAEDLQKLRESVTSLDFINVKTSKNKYDTLANYIKNNGIDLYGEDGTLGIEDIERLEALIDNIGDRVSDIDKQFLEAVRDTLKAAKEAEDELGGILSDYLGDLSGTMVDALWTEFIDGGESAWDAWEDAGSEAIGEIAKSMLRAQIQQMWLDKYLDPLKNAFAAQDIDRIAELVQAMTGDLETYKSGQSWLADLNARLAQMGIDLATEASQEGTLSSGIKSITEDTANLLASYLNGIRADVSYGRILWERMAIALEGMNVQGSTPSLAEYLPKLEAHAANIATTNQQLLTSLQSVITREGGLPAIRSLR